LSWAGVFAACLVSATTGRSGARRFFRQHQTHFRQEPCWTCHSADLSLSNLDLSTRDTAIKGGDHGPAIVPGQAEQSALYRHITASKSR